MEDHISDESLTKEVLSIHFVHITTKEKYYCIFAFNIGTVSKNIADVKSENHHFLLPQTYPTCKFETLKRQKHKFWCDKIDKTWTC